MASETKDKNKQGQTVVPAQPQPEPAKRTPVEEAERYVREAGWRHVGTNDRGDTLWADPASDGGVVEQVTAVRLENKDGGEPVEIKQTRCPPAPWDYPLMEAMVIQRERDRAPAKPTTRVVTQE